MSKWDKLLERICSLSKGLRFEELRKVLESFGYVMNAPRGGIIRFESLDVSRLPCQSTNKSKRLM